MNWLIKGIHHVTAIAGDPQENVDFYVGLLGLRLVKKTVNFDDPGAYHLYYGDAAGTPGSVVTFFYWPDYAAPGRVGAGQSSALTFSVAPASLDFWRERLDKAGVAQGQVELMGEARLRFVDPDGLPVEIVAVANDDRVGWSGGVVPAEHGLRGMHTIELTVRASGPTEALLRDVMGFRLVDRQGNRVRLAAGSGVSGSLVDVVEDASSESGISGAGTIHHVALNIADEGGQLEARSALREAGFGVSAVIDRSYFRSIYYRERGGVLFEIATEGPGFAVDEPPDSLGSALKLPPQYESSREAIEKALPPIISPTRSP